MLLNSLSDSAESLKLLTFVIFLSQVIKICRSVLFEKKDNISLHAVVCCILLEGRYEEVSRVAAQEEDAPLSQHGEDDGC